MSDLGGVADVRGGRGADAHATGRVVSAPLRPVLRDSAGRFVAGGGRPSRRGPGGPAGNMNAAKCGWRAFWRRKALRAEDRWVLPLLSDYGGALIADKGGADYVTAAERATVELATLARGCAMLILAQAAERDGLVGWRRGATLKGDGGAQQSYRDVDLAAALARFLAVELTALKTLGLARRPRPAPSLRELLAARAAGSESHNDSLVRTAPSAAPASSGSEIARHAGSGEAERRP